MQEPIHLLAAQRRETTERRTVAGAVGTLAAIAGALAVMTAPVVAAVAAVAVATVLTAHRRRVDRRPAVRDTRDGPRSRPEPAAGD